MSGKVIARTSNTIQAVIFPHKSKSLLPQSLACSVGLWRPIWTLCYRLHHRQRRFDSRVEIPPDLAEKLL